MSLPPDAIAAFMGKSDPSWDSLFDAVYALADPTEYSKAAEMATSFCLKVGKDFDVLLQNASDNEFSEEVSIFLEAAPILFGSMRPSLIPLLMKTFDESLIRELNSRHVLSANTIDLLLNYAAFIDEFYGYLGMWERNESASHVLAKLLLVRELMAAYGAHERPVYPWIERRIIRDSGRLKCPMAQRLFRLVDVPAVLYDIEKSPVNSDNEVSRVLGECWGVYLEGQEKILQVVDTLGKVLHSRSPIMGEL